MLDMSEIGFLIYMTECEEKKRLQEADQIKNLDSTSSVGFEREKENQNPLCM